MVVDKNKGIETIVYNHLNLPTRIFIQTDDQKGEINYIYDATGVKLAKKVTDYIHETSLTTIYANGFIYEQQENQVPELKFFSHAEGYFEPNSPPSGELEGAYVYQYKDHLGNIRLSYKDNNGNLEIVEENNYYPFGLKHKGYNNQVTSTNPALNYKYNGKELNDELGLEWHDFDARNYDASLGRWMNIDLLADLAYDRNPYHYVSNNPINRFDPDDLTDYTLNKKSGEVSVVEGTETTDGNDRIVKSKQRSKNAGRVKTKRNGESKVAIDNVEKGILADGQNFKTEGALIDVGQGLDGPGEAGVLKFMVDLAEHIGVEMGATLYSNTEKTLLGETTHVGITPYGVEGRKHTDHSSSSSFDIIGALINSAEPSSNYREVGRAHTHPTGSQYNTYQPSPADIDNKDQRILQNPGLRHIIVFRPKAKKSLIAFKTFNYTNSTRQDFGYDEKK